MHLLGIFSDARLVSIGTFDELRVPLAPTMVRGTASPASGSILDELFHLGLAHFSLGDGFLSQRSKRTDRLSVIPIHLARVSTKNINQETMSRGKRLGGNTLESIYLLLAYRGDN